MNNNNNNNRRRCVEFSPRGVQDRAKERTYRAQDDDYMVECLLCLIIYRVSWHFFFKPYKSSDFHFKKIGERGTKKKHIKPFILFLVIAKCLYRSATPFRIRLI